MIINSYLAFDGQCREAFDFYQKILGGEIVMMITYGDSPMADHTPPDRKDRIVHARLNIVNNVLMGGDTPNETFSKPQGFSVSITLTDYAENERIFRALSESANVMTPFEKSPFSSGFGMLIDQYGAPWMINCE